MPIGPIEDVSPSISDDAMQIWRIYLDHLYFLRTRIINCRREKGDCAVKREWLNQATDQNAKNPNWGEMRMLSRANLAGFPGKYCIKQVERESILSPNPLSRDSQGFEGIELHIGFRFGQLRSPVYIDSMSRILLWWIFQYRRTWKRKFKDQKILIQRDIPQFRYHFKIFQSELWSMCRSLYSQ
jgi:hypothetical protein